VKKINVGLHSYTNALPLRQCLEKEERVKLVDGVPGDMYGLLSQGVVDVALIPSAHFVDDDSLILLKSLGGIGSTGSVETVLLFCKKPWADNETVYLDTDSRTSVKLLGLLERHYWQKCFKRTVDRDNADVTLLIGDKAVFEDPRNYNEVVDLGQTWYDFCGLPFAWAVWASLKSSPDKANVELLLQSSLYDGDKPFCDDDYSKTAGVITNFIDVNHYLNEVICYQFDDDYWAGYSKFIQLVNVLPN
jgi:chorismate dehydratase